MYEELYEENKKALHAIAWHFRGLCDRDHAVSAEDLAQAAFIGLVRATQAYKEDSGKSWTICKKHYITLEIYAALGLKSRISKSDHPTPISLDAPLLNNAEDSATLAETLRDDSLPDLDDSLLHEEIQKNVRESINRLSDPRQRQVLMLHGIERRDMNEVASIIGIDTQHAVYIYNRALANLARDNKLMALADLDDQTRFYSHKGVRAVLRDRTSVTEEAALWRIDQKGKINQRFSTRL